MKPLSEEEALDIAELRLALIALALKSAYRHLSPVDFDYTYDLAKRITLPTAPRSTLNTIAAFGTPFSAKLNGQSCVTYSGSWRTERLVMFRF